jgi:hypothetical protein
MGIGVVRQGLALGSGAVLSQGTGSVVTRGVITAGSELALEDTA